MHESVQSRMIQASGDACLPFESRSLFGTHLFPAWKLNGHFTVQDHIGCDVDSAKSAAGMQPFYLILSCNLHQIFRNDFRRDFERPTSKSFFPPSDQNATQQPRAP